MGKRLTLSPASREEHFSIVGYQGPASTGRATVIAFDPRKRLGRALLALGLAWAAAIVSAFIPVAHFVLVPGFTLFGIAAFVARIRLREVTTSIRGTCPDCGTEQEFEPGGAWSLPRTLACRDCGRSLTARAIPRAA